MDERSRLNIDLHLMHLYWQGMQKNEQRHAMYLISITHVCTPQAFHLGDGSTLRMTTCLRGRGLGWAMRAVRRSLTRMHGGDALGVIA